MTYPDLAPLARLNTIAEQWHRRRLAGGSRHNADYATETMSDYEVIAELARLAREYAEALESQRVAANA